MNIDRFDSDRNDDNKYTRAMYFDMLELYKKAPRIWASLRGLVGTDAAQIRIIIDNTNFWARKKAANLQ